MFKCLDVEMIEGMIKQKNHYISQKQEKATGFTLVELLIVVFIVALLSGLVLASSWRGQNQYAVSLGAQKLAANLRLAQNMALAGKLQGASVPAGYGVYVSSASQYAIFYNTTSDKIYAAGVSVILETIAQEKAVLAPSGTSVFFTPPDPTTYINGATGGSQVFTITSNGYSKTVTVYSSGLIEVN